MFYIRYYEKREGDGEEVNGDSEVVIKVHIFKNSF